MSVIFETVARGTGFARAGRLVARLANGAADVEAAQRLRHDVFRADYGAAIGRDGLDRDLFDRVCLHLVVEDESIGRIVGTYRLLLPEQAREIGGTYTDQEFFTDRLRPIRDSIVELGRSCVDPDYRSGAVIMLLWSGLGSMFARLPYRYLIGCASVPMHDGGHWAASLFRQLWRDHAAEEQYRVFPKDRLPVESLLHGCDAVVPPLVKGYLRAGGRLLGEPHRDHDFRCADVPMMLDLDRLTGRYSRRFVRTP